MQVVLQRSLANLKASIVASQNSTAHDFVRTAGYLRQCLRIDLMFLLKYPRRQSLLGVVVANRNNPLRDNWPTIECFVNEVNSATSPLYSVFNRLELSVESRESRQQAGMNIQYPAWESLQKLGRQNSHVPGETNQIDVVVF